MNPKIEWKAEDILRIKNEFPAIFETEIGRKFLEKEEHLELMYQYISEYSVENNWKIRDAFRNFCFEIRFSKYLISIIRYSFIEFYRKTKKKENRTPVIYDKPVGEDEGLSFGEYVMQKRQAASDWNQKTNVDGIFENDWLHEAFQALTKHQQDTIVWSYFYKYRDNEISRYCAVSPQSIHQTRKKALQKLRSYSTDVARKLKSYNPQSGG